METIHADDLDEPNATGFTLDCCDRESFKPKIDYITIRGKKTDALVWECGVCGARYITYQAAKVADGSIKEGL